MDKVDGALTISAFRLTCVFAQARNAAAPAFVAAIQARTYADKASPTEVSSILEQRIRGVQEESGLAETGRVLSVGYVRTSARYKQNQLAAATATKRGSIAGLEANMTFVIWLWVTER